MVRKQTRAAPLSGRQAQARENDQRILEAAREVFCENPEAPIAAVARRAGVGIGALYRRYRSKKSLLDRVCLEGLHRYVAAAEKALADTKGDPWVVYGRFMREIVDADTHSNVLRLAGTFKPSKSLYRAAEHAQALNLRLFNRTMSARALRADIEASDIALLFEQLASTRLGDASRTARLRHRYLALLLDALTPRPSPPSPDLPQPGKRSTAGGAEHEPPEAIRTFRSRCIPEGAGARPGGLPPSTAAEYGAFEGPTRIFSGQGRRPLTRQRSALPGWKVGKTGLVGTASEVRKGRRTLVARGHLAARGLVVDKVDTTTAW